MNLPTSGLARLWQSLAQPLDPIAAADALVGVRPRNARQLVSVALAASREADALLNGLPDVLRSLSVSTASQPVRCEGEVRGPVLWSATMAARSASPGAGGVFICASPIKAFDTDENRVLVAALIKVVRASRFADAPVPGMFQPPAYDMRRARINGERARRALEHRSLQAVSHGPVSGRMLTKARSGTKAPRFKAAVELMQRSWRPVGADDLAPFVDATTAAEHTLAADVVDVLHSRGELTEPLRIVEGWVRGGRFAYAHSGPDGARDRRAGVLVDDRPVSTVAEI